MKLIDNWRDVALRSYSMWSLYLSIVALFTPDLIYLTFGWDTNPRFWWFLALGLILFGIVGRLILQFRRDDTTLRSPFWVGVIVAFSLAPAAPPPAPTPETSRAVTESAFLAVAVPHVARWEGKRNQAYLDTIAVPPVWTICYGETRGVQRGQTRTDAECDAMLGAALLEYRGGLHRAFTADTIAYRLTPRRDTSYTSLAYNAGIGAISKSTAVRRINAGDIRGGCEAIGWWNKAGGRVVRGLVNRRASEVTFCLDGLE